MAAPTQPAPAPGPRFQYINFADLTNWSVRFALENRFHYNPAYPLRALGSFLQRVKTEVVIQDQTTYQRVTVRVNNRGVVPRDTEVGRNIGTKRQFRVVPGQFLVSRIDARHGAMGLVPPELAGAVVTADFLPFAIDTAQIDPHFLVLITSTREFIRLCQNCSSGTTNRQRLDGQVFMDAKIPLPTLDEQRRLVAAYHAKTEQARAQRAEAAELLKSVNALVFDKLGLEVQAEGKRRKGFYFIDFSKIREWGFEKIMGGLNYHSSIWPSVSFDEMPTLVSAVYRGKSPVYDDKSKAVIINQKCVRWNDMAMEFAKSVSETWLAKADAELMTRPGDILVNSTGEGTIGRAALITEKAAGYLFDSHVLLVRVDETQVNASLLAEIINSPHGQKQIDGLKSAQSTKQTELGVGNLRRLLFPLPPLDFQNQLAAQVAAIKQSSSTLRAAADALDAAAVAAFEEAAFQAP